MAMITTMFPDLNDLRVVKAHDDEYEPLTSLDNPVDTLYGVKEINNLYEVETEISGIGDVPEFTGNLAYQDAGQEYNTQYNVKEYASGMKIQRLLLQTDQTGTMEGKAQALGEAGMRTIAKKGIYPFINASTLGMPGPGGNGDGLPLGSASHTSKSRPDLTFSNLYTTAFSVTQLETIRQNGLRTRNAKGEQAPVLYDMIICPPELHGSVTEAVGSIGKPNSANNDLNFQYGFNWKVYTTPWLTGATDWIVVSEKMMKRMNLWKWLQRPDFNRDQEFDTYMRKWSVYFAFAQGFFGWRWAAISDV